MSDYYWEQDSRAWRAHLNFEKNEKHKNEIALSKKRAEEKKKAEKQKAYEERFTRMPEPDEILVDCPTCGRTTPVFRFCNGIAEADYYPRCPDCGKEDAPIILGANVKEFIVEKIDYGEDDY